MSSLKHSSPRFVAALTLAAAPLFALTFAVPANAEQTFPGVIQQNYGGTCAPQCTLCHNRPEGGPEHYNPSELDTGMPFPDLGHNRGQGTFFANMVAINNARLPSSDEQLVAVLKKLATAPCTTDMSNGNTGAPCDSNGDGVPDMKEFALDKDPDGGDLCLGPKYGCGAAIKPLPRKPNATSRATAILGLLGLGLVAARRLRRPR
jgi:MYXO-CTERM domain-containing protein